MMNERKKQSFHPLLLSDTVDESNQIIMIWSETLSVYVYICLRLCKNIKQFSGTKKDMEVIYGVYNKKIEIRSRSGEIT